MKQIIVSVIVTVVNFYYLLSRHLSNLETVAQKTIDDFQMAIYDMNDQLPTLQESLTEIDQASNNRIICSLLASNNCDFLFSKSATFMAVGRRNG